MYDSCDTCLYIIIKKYRQRVKLRHSQFDYTETQFLFTTPPPPSTSNRPKQQKQQHRTLTFNNGKTNPTVKLENQFTIVDTETAADRGP